MSQINNLRLKIQVALEHPEDKTEQEIHELSVQYQDACQEVKRRTLSSVNYLRNGFRGEAVRLAEMKPDIFSLVALLDFPDRARWVSYAKSVGVETSELPFDMVDELQESLEAQEKNKKNIRMFRRANVFRRSENRRIELLKHLKKKEPSYLVWNENLRMLD